MYRRARVVLGALLLGALATAPAGRSGAQSFPSGNLPNVTPDQVEQLLGTQGRPTGPTSSLTPETTILEPVAPPARLSQPSRLEQILSARAGVQLSLFGYDQL